MTRSLPRSLTRCTTGLALVAALLAALMPSLSRAWALAAADGGLAAQVCTAQGPRGLATAADPAPALPVTGGHAADACGYCVLSGLDEAWLPFALPPVVPVAAIDLPWPTGDAGARRGATWRADRARAPPGV